MNRPTTGLKVRFLSIKIATGHGRTGNSTGVVAGAHPLTGDDAMPPRDPNDDGDDEDEDQDRDADPEDELDPAVIREPDE
jgi:hypothetical protein